MTDINTSHVPHGFDSPMEHMSFDGTGCFLCGQVLNVVNTEEHVFPKWVQQKYDIWNETVSLLNNTLIPYKSLKVLCCKECNNIHLSNVENLIKKSLDEGFENIKTLDKLKIFQWIGKIYYGLLFKQLFLAKNRKNPEDGKIINSDFLENFRNLHAMLQSVYRPFRFPTGYPFSILILNLYATKTGTYFFQDNLAFGTIMLQLGEIGIIISLNDSGFSESTYGKYIEELNGRKIHPIQFTELFAKVTYQRSLLTDHSKFLYIMNKDTTQPVDLFIFNQNREIRVWDQEEYSHYLRYYLSRWKLNVEFSRPNLVTTFMTDPQGKILILRPEDVAEIPSLERK